jgi:hypothetical protein
MYHSSKSGTTTGCLSRVCIYIPYPATSLFGQNTLCPVLVKAAHKMDSSKISSLRHLGAWVLEQFSAKVAADRNFLEKSLLWNVLTKHSIT